MSHAVNMSQKRKTGKKWRKANRGWLVTIYEVYSARPKAKAVGSRLRPFSVVCGCLPLSGHHSP